MLGRQHVRLKAKPESWSQKTTRLLFVPLISLVLVKLDSLSRSSSFFFCFNKKQDLFLYLYHSYWSFCVFCFASTIDLWYNHCSWWPWCLGRSKPSEMAILPQREPLYGWRRRHCKWNGSRMVEKILQTQSFQCKVLPLFFCCLVFRDLKWLSLSLVLFCCSLVEAPQR